eukprot:COSAG03_NODE_431_length_7966_cov_4.105123_6_plen_197_part_00
MVGGYVVTPRGGVYSPDVFETRNGSPPSPAEASLLKSGTLSSQPYDYIGVLDFECTCDAKDDASNPWVHEIIEWPLVLVDAHTATVADEFHHYIKPHERALLTPFCTELTGITQPQVDSGLTLPKALTAFDEWLKARDIGQGRSCHDNFFGGWLDGRRVLGMWLSNLLEVGVSLDLSSHRFGCSCSSFFVAWGNTI